MEMEGTAAAYASGIAESALATGASMIFGPNHPGRWRHRAAWRWPREPGQATRLLLVLTGPCRRAECRPLKDVPPAALQAALTA